MINITKTDFAMYFEGLEGVEVYLLDKDESKKQWHNCLGVTQESYFKLENDHWLVNTNPTFSESWMEDFNNDIIYNIKTYFDKNINWDEKSLVYFCISKYFVLVATWSFFKKNWISFVECEDDCPLVFSDKSNEEVILFKPDGYVDLYERQ
jgi:hypothetical protein